MAVFFLFTMPGAVGAASAAGKIIAGYYASWDAYSGYTPSDIPAGNLTHILYAFANISSDYKIAIGDPDVDTKNFTELRTLKKNYPNVRTLISVGGWEWSGKFSNMASTAARRETFAASAVAFMVKYGFDGIDLDWEYPVSGGKSTNSARAADKTNFTALLKLLREKLNAQGKTDGKKYLLTIAGGATTSYTKNVQMKSIAQYLDFSVLMAYDLHTNWDKYTDHNAPLYTSSDWSPQFKWSADQAVKTWISAGFPKSKLVLGVPFYGHLYSNVKDGNTGLYRTYSGYKTVNYDQVASKYLTDKAYVRRYGSAGRTPWLFNGSTFITYEDAQSLKEKAGYVTGQGLGGVGIWELSENADGTLLKALRNNLAK
jgi:chitinase